MQRSAISVISLSTETGRSTRTRSSCVSIAPMKARRLSSAMMDGADAAGEELPAHVPKARRSEPARQRRGLWKRQHRLWQVGIGIPMFRHRAPDRWQHAPEVEQVERSEEHTSELQSRLHLVC